MVLAPQMASWVLWWLPLAHRLKSLGRRCAARMPQRVIAGRSSECNLWSKFLRRHGGSPGLNRLVANHTRGPVFAHQRFDAQARVAISGEIAADVAAARDQRGAIRLAFAVVPIQCAHNVAA